MMFTKDNVLKFVFENKYVIPYDISNYFETTTILASSVLSELCQEKKIEFTFLKAGESPYYYDKKNKKYLEELIGKHFNENEKQLLNILKEKQVINEVSLTIAQKLIMEKLKDFAKLLEVDFSSKKLKFYIWYSRDLEETKNQILNALNQKPNEKIVKEENLENSNQKSEIKNIQKKVEEKSKLLFKNENQNELQGEEKIESYFKENNLKIIEKENFEDYIKYLTKANFLDIEIYFDCIYFLKKINYFKIIDLYSKSKNPNIIFSKNIPKKIFDIQKNLRNIKIIEI